jgi:hypothetical protein
MVGVDIGDDRRGGIHLIDHRSFSNLADGPNGSVSLTSHTLDPKRLQALFRDETRYKVPKFQVLQLE